MGLGDNHCYSSSIGRRVHNILEAIGLDAENELRQQALNFAPVAWEGRERFLPGAYSLLRPFKWS